MRESLRKGSLLFAVFPIVTILFFNRKEGIYPTMKIDPIAHFRFPTNMEMHIKTNFLVKHKNRTNLKGCMPCNFKVRNDKPNSTPRDVVIGCGISRAMNMIVFLKTLRTTGCKADCVFLLDSVAYRSVKRETMKIIHNCGGIIINCGDVPYTNRFDGHNYCYVFALEFITINRASYDRIIICDLFDTAFQGDPFNEKFSRNKLNIVNEGATFDKRTGEKNRQWLEAFNYYLPSSQENIKYLCSGFIGASTNVMIKSLLLYLMQHKFGLGRHDQAAFNYLYLSGEFHRNGIEVVGERENEPIRHTAFKPIKNKEIGFVETINNETAYASVIHHYYSCPEFINSLVLACPRETLIHDYTWVSH